LLLSVLGKIFPGILAGRLRDWLSNHQVLSEFQAGFAKGKSTSDNVFIIGTTVDKYLRVKRGKLYWCFVDFEKAFDSINREVLWFKMRTKGVSERMVSCLSNMYEEIKFCVRCGDNEVTNFVTQTKGVR
jgi:hypothetical protein